MNIYYAGYKNFRAIVSAPEETIARLLTVNSMPFQVDVEDFKSIVLTKIGSASPSLSTVHLWRIDDEDT